MWGFSHRLGIPEQYDLLEDALENTEMVVFWSADPETTGGVYGAFEATSRRYWLKELGLIHDFSVRAIAEESNQYQVKVQKAPDSAEVLITDVGFGVSQILPVLVLCYYVPEHSTVLLEHPEIHLHPSAQSGLADVFIDVIRNRHLQIIVESHSEHLLRRFQRRIAEEKLASDEAAFYFCEMRAGGSSLTPLELDLIGQISNWPRDFFGDEFGEMAEITKARLKRKQSQSA
jgi:predicted ATPase